MILQKKDRAYQHGQLYFNLNIQFFVLLTAASPIFKHSICFNCGLTGSLQTEILSDFTVKFRLNYLSVSAAAS